MTMSETVIVGFGAPGSVQVEVDDPNDIEECLSAFVQHINQMNETELMELITTEGDLLSENVHFIDGMDGHVYHEW